MKANSILKRVGIVLLSGALFADYNCKKNDEQDRDTQTASDFEQGQSMEESTSNMADVATDGIGSLKTAGNFSVEDVLACATITRDTFVSANPDTITIDFGATNCLGADGRYRRGIITIIHSGNKWTAGSYRTITFSNFFVNDHQIEGVHTITANGTNSSGNWNWTITAQNMKITKAGGAWHQWNSTRTREMIAGAGTPLISSDNVFLITGNASGSNSNGKSFTATITNPLRKEASCKWIVSGTVDVVPSNKPQRTLDFGSGTCDDQATVTINGKTYNITLQ